MRIRYKYLLLSNEIRQWGTLMVGAGIMLQKHPEIYMWIPNGINEIANNVKNTFNKKEKGESPK